MRIRGLGLALRPGQGLARLVLVRPNPPGRRGIPPGGPGRPAEGAEAGSDMFSVTDSPSPSTRWIRFGVRIRADDEASDAIATVSSSSRRIFSRSSSARLASSLAYRVRVGVVIRAWAAGRVAGGGGSWWAGNR